MERTRASNTQSGEDGSVSGCDKNAFSSYIMPTICMRKRGCVLLSFKLIFSLNRHTEFRISNKTIELDQDHPPASVNEISHRLTTSMTTIKIFTSIASQKSTIKCSFYGRHTATCYSRQFVVFFRSNGSKYILQKQKKVKAYRTKRKFRALGGSRVFTPLIGTKVFSG